MATTRTGGAAYRARRVLLPGRVDRAIRSRARRLRLGMLPERASP